MNSMIREHCETAAIDLVADPGNLRISPDHGFANFSRIFANK